MKAPSIRTWLTAAAALAAGAGAAVAHPPFGFLPGLLGWPLLLALVDGRRLDGGVKRAFAIGWLAGFAYFLIGCWWVAEAFLVNAEAHAWMAPFAASLLPAGLALFWGAACALYRKLAPDGVRRTAVFAGVFVLFEWLRGNVLTGFPWNLPGETWAAGSAPSQAAAVVGAYGLSLLTVFALAAFAPLAADGERKRRVGAAVLGAVVLAGLWLGGQARLGAARPTPGDTVVRVVQADVAQEAKWTEENFRDIVQRYVNLTARQGARTPDVVLWPEGALPASADEIFGPGSWVGPAIARSLEPGQTLLMGAYRGETDPAGGPDRYYNSLLALHDEGPALRVVAVYDKHRLVPFGEYLPLGGLMTAIGLRSLVHMPSDFSAGPPPAPIDLPGGMRVQPLICYESLYPGFTGGEGDRRPRWIANISNDAWFGRTSGPRQHLNLAAYRAIEEGLPVVRATPTGVSAVIDPWGRIRPEDRLEPGESGVVDARLPEPLAPTPFSRYGDLPFWVMTLAALIFMRRPRFGRKSA